MKPASSPPHLITLILLSAFTPLSLNMFSPSLAHIAIDLNTDYSLVSLAIAGYLMVAAVVHLIVGALSDKFGRRPIILWSLGIFAVASFGCALSQNIWLFLGFRLLQGGVIAGYTLSLAIVRDMTTEQKAAGLIGYMAMSMAIAPMLGPMIGGLFDTLWGWRSVFWFYALAATAIWTLAWLDLGETNQRSADSTGQRVRETVLLLRTPRFWGFTLCASLAVGTFYLFIAGAPLVAKSAFDLSTSTLGIYIGASTGGFVAGAFVSGRIASRFSDVTTMMIAGRLVACAGLFTGLVLVLLGILTPITYFGATVFIGIGNGLTMPSAQAGIMSVRPGLAGTAAGVNGSLTSFFGVILTIAAGFLMTETNAALVLMLLMLFAPTVGLAAAVWVRRAGRRAAVSA